MSWLWVGDLGMIKPHVERWASNYTGRELTIGELSIDLGPRIIVVADDVTFANAEWADPDHMVSVDRVAVDLVTSSLWNPPVVVEALTITNAMISLTERDEAPPNWALDLPPSEQPSEPAPEDTDTVGFLLRDAAIQNVELVYTSPDREAPVELVVSSLNQHVRDDDFLTLGVEGTLSGREFRIDGESGTWSALLAGKDVRYDIDGQFDTVTVSSDGEIDDLFAPIAPTIRFSAEGPAIDDLTEMLALGDEGSGDISVSGSLAPYGDEKMLLDITGNIGQTKLEATADFRNLTDFSVIDADVRFSGPDLGRVLAIAGITGVRKAPFLLVADVHRENEQIKVEKAEMIFGETQFLATADLPKFPALDDASVTLNVKGPDIARFRYLTGLPGAASGAFSIDLSLAADADQREFYELAMETSHGKLNATGEIKGAETFLGSTAKLDVEVLNLATFAAAWKLDIGDLPADTLKAQGTIEYVDGGIRTNGPVAVSLGPLSVSADGLIALAPGVAGTNLMFEVASEELRYVTAPWTDSPFVPPESVALNGRMVVEPGAFQFTDISGTLGNDQVAGDAIIRPAPGIAGSSISFSVIGDATEELLADVPDLKVRPGPFEISGAVGFAEDALSLTDLRFKRPNSELRGGVTLGLPVERKQIEFNFEADSQNVHGLAATIGDLHLTDQPFSFDIAGRLAGEQLNFDRLNVTLGDATLEASGLLELGDNPDKTRFEFDAEVPDMSRVGTLGDRSFSPQRFAVSASVEGSDSHVHVEDLRAELGDSSLDGIVRYRPGDRPFLEIDISSDRLVYQPTLVPLEDDGYDPEPKFDNGRMIPDIPMPFEALDAMDARFEVDITEFKRGKLHLTDVRIDADLMNGSAVLHDLRFRAPSGYLQAKAALHPADGAGNANLKAKTRDFALGIAKSNESLAFRGDVDINLKATGADLRTLLGNMSGIVYLRTTGGAFKSSRFFKLIYGDLLNEIISTINPFAESGKPTTIECIVAPLRIQDGQLASAPRVFVRTDRINISADTNINLKNERLDLGVRTSPRKILTISAAELVNPYAKIVGTMARPSLAVDEQGVLITGGAAVLTGGVSILAKAAWDRLARSGDPCKETREAASEALKDRLPAFEPFPETADNGAR